MKRFKIDIYSHGVNVTVFYTNDRAAILSYCEGLAVFDQVFVPRLKRRVRKATAVFATAHVDGMQYGFLRNEWPQLERHLYQIGYRHEDLEIITHTPPEGETVILSLEPGVGPRDHEQELVMDFITQPHCPDRVLNLRTGAGKAQPLHAKIKVPGGWSTMGEMKWGTKISAPDGTETMVIGVFPQNKRSVYRVTFEDGRQVECDRDHFWQVYDKSTGTWCTVSTHYIEKQLHSSSFAIPLITPPDEAPVILPDDPYEQGRWAGMNMGDIQRPIETLIPEVYLTASTDQRFRLLQGILGYSAVSEIDGTIRFTTPHYPLLETVQTLVWSVGGKAAIAKKRLWRKKLAEHQLIIRHNPPQRLYTYVSLPPRSRPLTLKIASVQYLRREKTQCIMVDHADGLYITDQYIVTHNTACGLMAAAHFQVRTGLVMSSRYIKTWLKSISWVLGLKKKAYCVVRGREELERIVRLSLNGENDYTLIFFTINTLRDFLKDYLTYGTTIDGVTPRELYSTLGIGLRIIDETHENIHALVQQTIHTHIQRSIYLSATLVSDNRFINQQYNKIFPLADRFQEGRNNDHALVYPVYYQIDNDIKPQYMGPKGYSHIVFEQWLLGRTMLLDRYFEFLRELVQTWFIQKRQDGQKMLLFCSTTQMCAALADYLAPYYPELTVTDYVSTHDESVLYNHDIVVTTPLSAGTGKDIPDLYLAISTVSIGSKQKNLQMLGRLRDMIHYPDMNPVYLYLVCQNIPKQCEYDIRRQEAFMDHCKSIEPIYTEFVL